jgi:hypothetical protein
MGALELISYPNRIDLPWERTMGALELSRPPHSSSSPSARAHAVAYIRATGVSPSGFMCIHWYGLAAVSRAHTSSSA